MNQQDIQKEVDRQMQPLIQMMQDLRNDFDDFKNSLSSAERIPIEIDDAFTGRGFGKFTGTGSAGSATTYNAFPVSNVPSNPSGTVLVTINGTDYELLYK